MRSVFNFLVEPKDGITTAKKDVGGNELLLNTELQNHQYTSRHGVVVGTPLAEESEVQVGDEIIVHHNVFRVFRDVRGIEKNSKSYINDNLYSVAPDQVFAFKRGDAGWQAIKGFCFVKPIANKNSFSLHNEREAIGIIKYASATNGLEVGALVGFRPGSEYEFNIEEQRVYRVPVNLITIQYDYQGDEEEYNPSWAQGS